MKSSIEISYPFAFQPLTFSCKSPFFDFHSFVLTFFSVGDHLAKLLLAVIEAETSLFWSFCNCFWSCCSFFCSVHISACLIINSLSIWWFPRWEAYQRESIYGRCFRISFSRRNRSRNNPFGKKSLMLRFSLSSKNGFFMLGSPITYDLFDSPSRRACTQQRIRLSLRDYAVKGIQKKMSIFL